MRGWMGIPLVASVLLTASAWPVQAAVAAAPSSAASCELQGSFKTTPALKTSPIRMRYTIVGTVNDCHWTDGGTESGTFTAAGSGTASCGSGTTKGVAHITWNDHRASTM